MADWYISLYTETHLGIDFLKVKYVSSFCCHFVKDKKINKQKHFDGHLSIAKWIAQADKKGGFVLIFNSLLLLGQ